MVRGVQALLQVIERSVTQGEQLLAVGLFFPSKPGVARGSKSVTSPFHPDSIGKPVGVWSLSGVFFDFFDMQAG